MKIYNFLAFDLGATSGRSVVGTLRDGKIEIRELTRFANGIVEVHGKFYWNLFVVFGKFFVLLLCLVHWSNAVEYLQKV